MTVVDDKTALLDQLRLERSARPTSSGGRGALMWGAIAGVILILAALLLWWFAFSSSALSVRAVAARGLGGSGGSGASLLDASGYVVALREATVSAKSIDKVDEVLIQEGQAVKQGQVIARLDDTNTRAALEQAAAQVKQTAATLSAAEVAEEDARPVYERDQKQLSEGLISQEAFDSAKASYDSLRTAAMVAKENLSVAQASLQINQRFEDDTIIKAPFNGVVTVKTAQPGEIVSPQFSGGGGVAKIVDMDSLEVDVDVSENFINRVHAQQAATITLNAYPDWQIPAEVIAVIPTADRSKATIKVRVGFKQKDARIVPDMGARVSFLERGDQNAAAKPVAGVIVPTDAVQSDGTSTNGVVYVINDNVLERREVRLGARTGDGQIILSGVQVGTMLAQADFAKLHDGQKVRLAP